MRMSRRNRAAIPPGTCRRFRRSTTPPKFPYAAALTPPDQGAFIDLKLGGRLRWTCPRPDRAEKECDRLSREATRLWRTATHPHNLLTDIRSAARPDSNVRRSETQRANARPKNVGLKVGIMIWIVLGLFVIAVFALARWTAAKTQRPQRPSQFGSAVHNDDITVRPA